MTSLNTAMKQVTRKGFYTCTCGNNVEPDGKCYCGRKNHIIEAGFI